MNTEQETQLILLLSAIRLDDRDIEAVRGLAEKGPDWDKVVSCLVKHGTAGIAYRNIGKAGFVPAGVVEALAAQYNHALSRNMRISRELDRVLGSLAEKGINVVTLKGPVTSEMLFEDIGLYPSEDIDILVKVGDIDSTRSSLEALGYRLIDKGFDEYRDYFLKELYHLRFSNGIHVVEPHWNLFFRYFKAEPEFWWEDCVVVSRDGRSYFFLSPEKNVLYNSFRLYSKSFGQLRFLVILAELIRYYSDVLDWDRLFSYAAKHGFTNVLRVALRLSSELMNAPVPKDRVVTKGPLQKVLYEYIKRSALSGGGDRVLNKILLIFFNDDLWDAVRVLFRRLFPSMGEIVMRYKLPANSARAVIYYLLNPFMLIMRKRR